ncbi:flagellar motor protein MotB [Paracoccus xiamenensis]|uniref:flagellar motor protein MotB n=1 Tax=Paracoccus xiamenensis TaxID=2714901 RepID=UPI00140DB023|nr:flagellar motor protein MotB [Paracoccus xiamenensis]NHF72909.1 OmpA family protein [Paracoccus xiamenensis]
MTTRGGNAPIVIKRITISEEGGHHGGAWKVAYADFVTAMMAFFLLMWLLNATTEKQRQGLADYFSPTVVRMQSGQGSEGADQGDGSGKPAEEDVRAEQDPLAALNSHIQNQLQGIGAESMQKRNILRHVVTRVTDEGLVIELSDLVEEPLFTEDTASPTPTLRQLAEIVARAISRTRNQVAIAGHVRSYPAVLARSPIWDLSNQRADAVRELLENTSLPAKRIQRVTGYADRRSQPANPAAPSNNRIELILLK